MLRYLTLSALACMSMLNALSQGDTPALAPTVSTPFYTLGVSTATTMVGSSASGVTADGLQDQFFHFVAPTQGVRVQIDPTGFDAQIEILNAGELVLGTENAVGSGASEVMFANFLVAGNEYYVRVSSTGGAGAFSYKIEELPEAELRASFSPNPSTDNGLPGYRMGDQTKRNNINTTVYPVNLTSNVQATMWEFTDQIDGTVHTGTVFGSNGTLVLDDIASPSTLCYGHTYDVRVQLRMEAKWCGWGPILELTTEAYPEVSVLPAYLNTSYLLQPGFLRTNYLGDGQSIEWHLETNQGSPDGATVVDYIGIGNSTYCYFQNVECMRYNKIYSVEVRAQYCGVWGPWSDAEAFYTSPLPYTNVREEYCDTDMYSGDALFADFIEGADQYAWQAAPIDPADPSMTPIGPALTTTTPTTTLYLSSLGVEWGQSYRLGCKAILGTADDCDDYQEGDYGYFCPVHIIDPSGAVALESAEAGAGPESEAVYADERIEIISNGSDNMLTLDISEAGFAGTTWFTVTDTQGRVVGQQEFWIASDMNQVQFALNQSLSSGIYVVSGVQEGASLTSKFIVH